MPTPTTMARDRALNQIIDIFWDTAARTWRDDLSGADVVQDVTRILEPVVPLARTRTGARRAQRAIARGQR